ncbi:MAG: glycerol-3-phosphate acyltransferase [Bacteroidales bacterium]
MNEILDQIRENFWLCVIISSVPAYFIGSVSFARILYFFVKKSPEIGKFSEAVPHSDEVFESDLVSATLVAKQLGAKYGCLTSIADMAKVAVPALLVKTLLTAHPFYLLTAVFGIFGHNYPVYYSFKGGRGESPLLGALLVINWFGLLIVNVAATILGFITGSVLVVRWGGYILMVPWLWIYFKDIWYVLFMLVANLLFWFSMRKDLARFNQLKKEKGLKFTEEEVSEFILMGKSLGRALDKYSIYAMIKKRIRA